VSAAALPPPRLLVVSFLILIAAGAALLMLPKATTFDNVYGRMPYKHALNCLFTATSATCVTGLIVKDTGQDFTVMGQIIILVLIQLGGLGIVVFGAVIALLLGQALSLRESVAMTDLLSTRTLSRIGNMIFFIFVVTVVVEILGAVALHDMWDGVDSWSGDPHPLWFCSIFHSISAFCNAGFSLFTDSFIDYNRNWQIYVIVCPLIILGGLGFGVLYNLANVIADHTRRFVKRRLDKQRMLAMETPNRIHLQSKIVLSVSAVLIVLGALALLLFEQYSSATGPTRRPDLLGAVFQSVTARTAGFNTVDIAALTPSSKFVLILLMFIGGSPGSTAGGIKTVTLAVIVMAVNATLRKRGEVEMFRRSVRTVVVGRAITVAVLFVIVLFGTTFVLSLTESSYRSGEFTMLDVMFEAASALGTVGLSTGLTPELTDAGKCIIIAVMLIGRLGPLTLLASLTFNLKPARYNYPDEAVIVG